MNREIARLEVEIALCERCYGPELRLPVRFERPQPETRILVLGERPPRTVLESSARLGPSSSDAGTRFLVELLGEAGIPTDRVMLGASTLCRPVSRELEQAVPASACLRECAAHVRELVRVVRPRLVLPLGATALRSLRAAFPADATLRRLRFPAAVGQTVATGGLWVHPLYHTTARARVTRPPERQRRDWREVGRLQQWIESGERGPGPRSLLPHRQPEEIVA